MSRGRRLRAHEDLTTDPRLPYMIGHLAGAGEMAAHWMQMQADEQTKAMGLKLAQTVGWFFEADPSAGGSERRGKDVAS